MSMKENVQTIAENVPKVYEAGQASMVDESKIIEKTASGTGVLTLEDVSEIPHDVKIQLSSDTVEDFSTTEVKVTNVNILPYPYAETTKTLNGITYTDNGDGSVTIKGTSTGPSYFVLANKRMLDLGEKTIWHTSTSGGYRLSQYLFYNGNIGTTSISFDSGATVDETLYPMVVVGNVLPEYQPYTGQAYTPNVDGTVNVKSVSPVMNIFCDTDGVNIIAEYHKSYGMQVEYDAFWGVVQQNGNRKNYDYMFCGNGFVDILHEMKYDIKDIESCNSMFLYFNRGGDVIDFTEICKRMDFSSCTAASRTFANCKADNITVDFSNAVQLYMTFSANDGIYTQKNISLSVSEKCTIFNNTFGYQSNLTNLMFTDGSVIAANISFVYSKLLTNESVDSIINALQDRTGQTALKITFHTDVVAKLTEEQLQQIADKNWQVG